MNQHSRADEEKLTVDCGTRSSFNGLASYVEDHDFFYPPDPGEKSATHRRKYQYQCRRNACSKIWSHQRLCKRSGSCSSNGKIVEFGGKVVKNSSGYSLKDLMIGSEGNPWLYHKSHFETASASKESHQSADSVPDT